LDVRDGQLDRDADARLVGGSRAAEAPEAGRRLAVMAAECLGELGGLPVAHPVGDLADREATVTEHLRRALHPHGGEVLAERGVADSA
jgi:hypothetical protein